MPGLGRNLELTWDGAVIAGVRTKGITVNGEPVDITDDDSNGWREVFDDAGQVNVELSISGLTKDDRLKVAAFDVEDRVHAVVLTYPDGGIIAGDFYLQDFSDTGEYNTYITFEATLISDGSVSFTPGT